MFTVLPMAVLPYPQIDPVLIEIGPLAIRWYALAYIAGILLGWWYALRLIRKESLWTGPAFAGKPPATANDIDDYILWVTVGIIAGGRIGYLLFYGFVFEPQKYADPHSWYRLWEGGMSFHGGVIGVVVTTAIFAILKRIDMLKLGDLVVQAVPMGIFFGRLGNFINGELYGKVTDVPWAMVFPAGGPEPRHPSQLYEAALEGLALFAILRVLCVWLRWHERPGLLIAAFLALYGAFRWFCELFRDSNQLVDAGAGFSMGMALSIPMFAGAALFAVLALMRKPQAA
jgi:phosphatidylglycerol:prolipoprotein diacylglycerol transferase